MRSERQLEGNVLIKPDKELLQKRKWQLMLKRGVGAYLGFNVLIFVASYFLVRICHVLAFRAGWLRSPGSTSLEDILVMAVATGLITGLLEWSDLKRKFKDPPPEEDWMTK